ncbi:TetR/AcrR family transcriptional regulator [Ottowia sp. VDI28]|uniref:TetR/AcrR family transcriptional regulator n=1 Tax=Ottowia sp. VDI28 TaxID=3133968 RepID=UPI003C2D1A89
MFKKLVHLSNPLMPAPVLPPSRSPTPPSRRAASAERRDRRTDILLAAEKLFAQHGYHAVSLRQIASEAGVPLALVGYYFGAKNELFHAIFERWQPTIEARLALLREAVSETREQPSALPRIVSAFVEPVLRMRASPEGESYALLVSRELSYARDEADRVLHDFFDPLAHAFIDALHSARPGVSRAQVAWSYQFALGALLHHISDRRIERLSHGVSTPNDADAAPLLVRFITAGIDAALQTQTTPRRPS